MSRKYLALCVVGLGLALGACQENVPIIVKNRLVVVKPPESFYNCPQVKDWPKSQTLTDVQVAKLLNQLAKNNKICGVSLETIKQYIEDAAKKYDEVSKN